MRGVCTHIIPALRADLKEMPRERWETSLRAPAAIGSLDRPPRCSGHREPATKIGFQNRTPPLPESGQTDQGK
jgi:hypothetical protein